jgi:hypothetical protein
MGFDQFGSDAPPRSRGDHLEAIFRDGREPGVVPRCTAPNLRHNRLAILWEKLELERSVGDTGPGVEFVVEFNLEQHSPDADDSTAPDVSVLAPLDAHADGRVGGFEGVCGSGDGIPA